MSFCNRAFLNCPQNGLIKQCFEGRQWWLWQNSAWRISRWARPSSKNAMNSHASSDWLRNTPQRYDVPSFPFKTARDSWTLTIFWSARKLRCSRPPHRNLMSLRTELNWEQLLEYFLIVLLVQNHHFHQIQQIRDFWVFLVLLTSCLTCSTIGTIEINLSPLVKTIFMR